MHAEEAFEYIGNGRSVLVDAIPKNANAIIQKTRGQVNEYRIAPSRTEGTATIQKSLQAP